MLKTVGFPSSRTGDQTIINGNLVIATSGKGIDFSATSNPAGMTSELLNDYEEGTFTPTISGQTTAGVGTYTSQTGLYTKVGSLVTVQIFLAITAHTGTGNILITNLPFTTNAGTNAAATIGYLNDCTLTASNYPLAFLALNATHILLAQSPVGGGSLDQVAMDQNFGIIITATYRSA
jgi:hypothetical protein